MLAKRTNILFEEDMWDKLVMIAQSKNRSVGDLVRTAVYKIYYADRDLERLAKSVSEVRKIRKYIGKVNYKELINAGRKY